MQQIQDTGLFENLKEKMANPALFTYFWIFLATNWKNILFIIYEPLKLSDRIESLPYTWNYTTPLVITAIAVFTLPWINSVIEIGKQASHRWLQHKLNNWHIKAMVSFEEHEKVNDKLTSARAQLSNAQSSERESISRLEEILKQRNNLEDDKAKDQELISSLKNENEKLHEKIKNLEEAIVKDAKQKEKQNRKNNPSSNSVTKSTKDIAQQRVEEQTTLEGIECPIIEEVKVGNETYKLGLDFNHSNPGKVNVIKLRDEFNFNDKIGVSFKVDKTLKENQFFSIFDGYGSYETTEQHFELHKADYESKNAFVVVMQQNPIKPDQKMTVSNKVQFPY